MTVLVDAGPIVAMMDADQPEHAKCLAALEQTNELLVTCEAVIAEACHLLRKFKSAQRDILRDVAASRYAVSYRLAERADVVGNLLSKYANVPMDLADACLVDLASIYQTGRIFTLDSDFRVYRWDRIKPFELLLDA